MKRDELKLMSDDVLARYERSVQALADSTQREAARLQRDADRARKEIKRRKRAAKETTSEST